MSFKTRRTAALERSTAGILLVSSLFCVYSLGRLSSREPSTPQPDLALKLNPNTASAAELEVLPGIGPTLAKRIVEHRQTAPAARAFKNAEDLDAVPGIGPARVEQLRSFLSFDEAKQP